MLRLESSRALMVNGDTAELYWKSIDRLKNNWTGFALSIELPWYFRADLRLMIFSICCLPAAIYLCVRFRRFCRNF